MSMELLGGISERACLLRIFFRRCVMWIAANSRTYAIT
eukprot:gene10418-21726_t